MNPLSKESSVRPILSVGRYTLYGEHAAGAVANVHYGLMRGAGGFNKTVSILRLHPDKAGDPEFVSMFLDHAVLSSRVAHPNLVATLDIVRYAGEVFLVMDYIRGERLQNLLQGLRTAVSEGNKLISVPIAVSITTQVLAGLHEVHEAVSQTGNLLGAVHCNVSPHLIMIGQDGVARVTDVGIAKAESCLQDTHNAHRKLPYMAPEQLGGGVPDKVDRRADIYSAAVVLWEMLAGTALFRANYPGELIAKVLAGAIPDLGSCRSDVHPALESVVRKALSRDPSQRYGTAQQFVAELEQSVGGIIASPRVVGAWVASLAANSLANSEKYVREMEQSAASDDSDSDPDDDVATTDLLDTIERVAAAFPSSKRRSAHGERAQAGVPQRPSVENHPALQLASVSRMYSNREASREVSVVTNVAMEEPTIDATTLRLPSLPSRNGSQIAVPTHAEPVFQVQPVMQVELVVPQPIPTQHDGATSSVPVPVSGPGATQQRAPVPYGSIGLAILFGALFVVALVKQCS